MKEILVRAGRVLKYRVVHRAERYAVKHVHGWAEAENITGSTVKEVEQRIAEIYAPVVQELSINRMLSGYRIPQNFGDKMREFLRRDCTIIDRSTGLSVDKPGNQAVVLLVGGFVNFNSQCDAEEGT
jgi:hypothetical protein